MAASCGAFAQSGCNVTSLRLWKPETLSDRSVPIATLRDLKYGLDDTESSERHRLDLFYPRDSRTYPVIVLVHGGAWIMGDNRCSGLYSSVGEFLAGRGIGVVMPNYRLAPGFKHPAPIQDLARVVHWTHEHIRGYGGDPARIVLMGHSAGGHLVSLLSTDATYLQSVGLQLCDIKGTISVSGVYTIPAEPLKLSLGGTEANAFHWNQLVPLRGDGQPDPPGALSVLRVPISLDAFAPAFDVDPELRASASPLTHVGPGLQPFLLISAEHDLPTLPTMAQQFHKALLQAGCESKWERIPSRNHNSILFSATHRFDPVAALVLDFMIEKANLSHYSSHGGVV